MLAYLNGFTHLLLNNVDVIVVEPQIPHEILHENPPPSQGMRLVSLHHFSHQAFGHFILGPLQLVLNNVPEIRHATARGGARSRIRWRIERVGLLLVISSSAEKELIRILET